MLNEVLSNFGLNPSGYQIQAFGSGLINHTYKISGEKETYILQEINSEVFKSPKDIAENMASMQKYLNYLYPGYLFVGTLPSADFLFESDNGKYYRLFPFVKGSQTINFVNSKKEAFEAARQFGRFTYLLRDFDLNSLNYTLTNFHDLPLRFDQFKLSARIASKDRMEEASSEIKQVYSHYDILETYKSILINKEIPVRAIHHDTKISNVLFDDQENGLCVIDLDTVMPGYFWSDVGDMMRTYLSPANEEETDLSKITIREDVFRAVCKGYLSEMAEILTLNERKYFTFSGKLMIYMQAIRFLTDYLNNDIYYSSKYEGHNLNRAKNQFTLLNAYIIAEEKFKNKIGKSGYEYSNFNDDILKLLMFA